MAAAATTKDKFAAMKEWLRKNGGQFNKIYLTYGTDGLRGAHAQKELPSTEEIIFVPLACIMTSDVAKASNIGKKLLSSGVELRSAHSYLACYLVAEKYNANSFWRQYIDILPEQYSTVPIYYDKEELGMLEGSFTLPKIEDRKQSLEMEYNNICRHVPEFGEYSVDDFIWARLSVITRIFGIVANNVKTDGLVPMADFLTHKRPRETKWTYSDAKGGFVVATLTGMKPGTRITTSFGVKCNSRFFVNYGFIVENNAENEARFSWKPSAEDPLYGDKVKQFGLTRTFQIPKMSHNRKTEDCFSFFRAAVANAEEWSTFQRIDAGFLNISGIKPISIDNEKRVLQAISDCAAETLENFPTTLEDDDEILGSDVFLRESNKWMCVIMRRSEKEVLHYYIKLASQCIAMLDSSWEDLKREIIKYYQQPDPMNKYVTDVVARLMRERNFGRREWGDDVEDADDY